MERSALHRKIKQLGISLTEKEETEKNENAPDARRKTA